MKKRKQLVIRLLRFKGQPKVPKTSEEFTRSRPGIVNIENCIIDRERRALGTYGQYDIPSQKLARELQLIAQKVVRVADNKQQKGKTEMKKLLTLLAVGSALVVQTQAAQISGGMGFTGLALLNGTANTATEVTAFGTTVVDTANGAFAPTLGNLVSFFPGPWVFNPSTPKIPLWTVGGFTFNLESSVFSQGAGFLNVLGTGTITSGADSGLFNWRFSTQDPAIGQPALFTFSASTAEIPRQVPDGGMTLSLLGLAVMGLGAARRFLA